MAVKTFLILCAQALFVKSTLGQCTSRAAVTDAAGIPGAFGFAAPAGLAYNSLGFGGNSLAYNGLGAGCGRGLAYDGMYTPAIEYTTTRGGALPVSSASAIAPIGISVASDNVYEGLLAVGGELPFVGTVAMEGVVPSAGAGAVNHACGNGRNAMISETAFTPSAAAYGPAAAIAPAAFGTGTLGYSGFGSSALGYGSFGSSALGYGSSAFGYGAYGAGCA